MITRIGTSFSHSNQTTQEVLLLKCTHHDVPWIWLWVNDCSIIGLKISGSYFDHVHILSMPLLEEKKKSCELSWENLATHLTRDFKRNYQKHMDSFSPSGYWPNPGTLWNFELLQLFSETTLPYLPCGCLSVMWPLTGGMAFSFPFPFVWELQKLNVCLPCSSLEH